MIKVVIITPYPELGKMAASTLREYSNPAIACEVTHAYGTVLETFDFGSPDIIVARGLTQRALRDKYTSASVLEFTVSPYDILRAIHESRNTFGTSRVALLGTDTILYDVDALKEIINADIKIFPITNEEDIRRALAEARTEGFEAVVGGLTVSKIARELGWNSTFIKTSEESFRMAVREAMNMAEVMYTERAKAEITRAVLQNSKEAILYFGRDARLEQYNRRAGELLSLPAGAAGLEAGEIFRDHDIIDTIRSRGSRSGMIKNVNSTPLVADFTQVRLEEQVIGVICSLQRVNEIQDTESMIRTQLNKKGLAAKYGFDNIIHASDSMDRTIATAHKYAEADANVLLIGETGTGKELFAHSIHLASPRRRQPFVAVNCAAFPEHLLESELFGYTEGAFSGASKGGKAGLFELAHGGTLFLDEIGEIPLSLQASLLRVLQEREIRRIGGDKVVPVNVRVIAATNRDLRKSVREGSFRMDLLYRLEILSLFIPPLRERAVDISLIAGYYLDRYCRQYGKPALQLDESACETLAAYPWPGNTRELRNVCERLAVLCGDETAVSGGMLENLLRIGSELPDQGSIPLPGGGEPRQMEELVEFAQSVRVRRADIANMLGISRTTLWRRMKNKKADN